MQAAAQRRKGRHDQLLQVGQQVYLRLYSVWEHKIQDAWNDVVHKVENPSSDRGQEQEDSGVLCLGEALKRRLSLRLKSCQVSAPVCMNCQQKSRGKKLNISDVGLNVIR
ncbi:hypothetical protein SRHO_G00246720 [Serrasalmus rhombeus]